MEKKQVSRGVFINFIADFTKKSVESIKQAEDVIILHATSKSEDKKVEFLGKCPLCSKAVVEGQKGFGCSNWKSGCKFVIWKNDKFLATMKKKPTKTMVKQLLKDGQALVKGLTSKKGNKFDAIMKYEKNSDNDYFSWKLEFVENQQENTN